VLPGVDEPVEDLVERGVDAGAALPVLGPVEGLTGILMCGLSAGLFFALVTSIYASRLKAK